MVRRTARFWENSDNVERLIHLHSQGLSFSFIARELGCTKNMICGKAYRLGLAERGTYLRGKSIQLDKEPPCYYDRSEASQMEELRRQNESALAALWEHHGHLMQGRAA